MMIEQILSFYLLASRIEERNLETWTEERQAFLNSQFLVGNFRMLSKFLEEFVHFLGCWLLWPGGKNFRNMIWETRRSQFCRMASHCKIMILRFPCKPLSWQADIAYAYVAKETCTMVVRHYTESSDHSITKMIHKAIWVQSSELPCMNVGRYTNYWSCNASDACEEGRATCKSGSDRKGKPTVGPNNQLSSNPYCNNVALPLKKKPLSGS
jgi:hypothetical protein